MSANHADFHNRYDSFLKQRSFNIPNQHSQNSPHGASDNNFLGEASFIPNASLIPNTSPFDGNPVEVPASEPAAEVTKYGTLYQTNKVKNQRKIVKKEATTNTERFGEELFEQFNQLYIS